MAVRSTTWQSVTFWCRYWFRHRNRHHFGLENGPETSLVTLSRVIFWSRNGLKTGIETILVSKTVSRPGLVKRYHLGKGNQLAEDEPVVDHFGGGGGGQALHLAYEDGSHHQHGGQVHAQCRLKEERLEEGGGKRDCS